MLSALPSLREFNGVIEWVSPLEEDKFREYRDDDFLSKLGAGGTVAELRNFWPANGPCWDALAKVQNGVSHGIVLVEAKSYTGEILGDGCGAGARSRAQIERSMTATKRSMAANPSADWLGPLYQCANRLAHLYFFREILRVPAWLINICFIDDPRTPTSKAEWLVALAGISSQLGLTSMDSAFSASVFIEAKADTS